MTKKPMTETPADTDAEDEKAYGEVMDHLMDYCMRFGVAEVLRMVADCQEMSEDIDAEIAAEDELAQAQPAGRG